MLPIEVQQFVTGSYLKAVDYFWVRKKRNEVYTMSGLPNYNAFKGTILEGL